MSHSAASRDSTQSLSVYQLIFKTIELTSENSADPDHSTTVICESFLKEQVDQICAVSNS